MRRIPGCFPGWKLFMEENWEGAGEGSGGDSQLGG